MYILLILLYLYFVNTKYIDVDILLKNDGYYPLFFMYCNTTNILTTEISDIIYANEKEYFNFMALNNFAHGDCTYQYGDYNCLLNFQFHVDNNSGNYYYGITHSQNYTTEVKILSMYSVLFTLS